MARGHMLRTGGVGGARGKAPPDDIIEIYRAILDLLSAHHGHDGVSIQKLVDTLTAARERLTDDDDMDGETWNAPAPQTAPQ